MQRCFNFLIMRLEAAIIIEYHHVTNGNVNLKFIKLGSSGKTFSSPYTSPNFINCTFNDKETLIDFEMCNFCFKKLFKQTNLLRHHVKSITNFTYPNASKIQKPYVKIHKFTKLEKFTLENGNHFWIRFKHWAKHTQE